MVADVVDMTGRLVRVPHSIQRIVSLVPSQTELLYHLGLEDQVVGVTKFCVHPSHARRQAKVVGGTKNIRPERVMALAPDLVIGNKEENDKDSIESLARKVPVWLSDIFTLDDALGMIREVGQLCQRETEAARLADTISLRFARLAPHSGLSSIRMIYLIWANPWMGVASRTFIHHMIGRMGVVNVLEDSVRYPEISDADLIHLAPDVVFLSSEPFPFRQEHEARIRQLLPGAIILQVDGEMFSWYGSRLLDTPDYLSELSLKMFHLHATR